jgi:hypothetical protein
MAGATFRQWGDALGMSGGKLGGKMQLSGASQSQAQPAGASVCAGQALYEALRDLLVVHGKEKVYGSIP